MSFFKDLLKTIVRIPNDPPEEDRGEALPSPSELFKVVYPVVHPEPEIESFEKYMPKIPANLLSEQKPKGENHTISSSCKPCSGLGNCCSLPADYKPRTAQAIKDAGKGNSTDIQLG